MEKFIHSVALDKDLCKGCINCIKRCPTEAIRVRDGKAHIDVYKRQAQGRGFKMAGYMIYYYS